MSRRLLLLLLVAFVAQGVHGKSDDPHGYENDLDAPPVDENDEEGSGAHPLGEIESDVPLIDDTDAGTTVTPEDAIQCPSDLCTCSQESDGETLKLTVDCSAKELTELPTGIDKRVKHLFLQNNKLEELPKAISEFQELEELNVNDNSIKGFAYGSVGELSKLRVLKAANNRLLEFPQELKNGLDLRSLEELDLGGNDMRDTLTADHFIHMETIKSLTIPVSTHELIEDLCHRLGDTLQKVCTNDCSKDIEDCANFSETPSDLIPAPSADTIDNPTENQLENTEEDIALEESEGTNAPEPSVGEDPLPDPISSDDAPLEQPQTNSALAGEEISGGKPEVTPEETKTDLISSEAPAVTTTESVPSSEEPPASISPAITDFSLRNAVSGGVDEPNSPIKMSSGIVALDVPAEAGQAQSDGSSTKAEGAEKQSAQGSETNEVKVGATSVKQGGGIDNSVIALIVAGMVIVVAGVTIKKNWSSIKNRFRSRPSPAPGADGGQVNGTSPEEVPLQDKSMV